MIYSFAPMVDADCRVLILGSMPSVRSLERQQYYGHKLNYFWPMMFTIFEEPASEDYTVKQELLLRRHIALWDVLQSCEREGSLDSNIVNERPNDFPAFFAQYPALHTIFFNGGKAYQSFKKHYPQLLLEKTFFQMPSTSPAHTMKREEKLAKWQTILTVL